MPTGSHILKMCTCCGQVKPLKEFFKRWKSRKNRHEQCRSCKYEKRHKAIIARGESYSTEWKRTRPEIYHRSQDKYYAKQKGLDWDRYLRIEAEQKGLCAICKRPNIAKGKRRLSIDHDHNNEVFRGLICHHCNMVLGYAKDCPEVLVAAAGYLDYAEYALKFDPIGLGC
jgi:hypothetical protein